MSDNNSFIEMLNYEELGEIIYPVVQVQNKEADATQKLEAAEFIKFLESEEAKAVFEKYYFITE